MEAEVDEEEVFRVVSVQLFQFAIGSLLLKTSIMEDDTEWQVKVYRNA